jgi:hypothetical protein
MGKCLINRDQCNTAKELSVKAQAAFAAITIESVNRMAGDSSTALCAVLALRGQCLNAPSDVVRDLRRGTRTPEGLPKHEKPSQNVCIDASNGVGSDSPVCPRCQSEWIAQSLSQIRMLPSETQEWTGMAPAHCELRGEAQIVSRTISGIKLRITLLPNDSPPLDWISDWN